VKTRTQTKSSRRLRIVHRHTGTLVAEGAIGWEITPFEGNYYIGSRALREGRFTPTFVPGVCIYKFLYTWLDFELPNGNRERNLGWFYWLPNPLLPFIWFRVAVPNDHPALAFEQSRER